mmetsp:Transcript_28222/g.68694  ORF Transcript_28222/g.68694 Transcript_28222/m.68694 type:complete len:1035 (-) Transcript_28222:46-3150(-)
MRSPGGIQFNKKKNGKLRESTTSHTQDETDHDDDVSVGNHSMADQARRSWMAKDAQIQRSNRSIMTEQPPRTTQSPGRSRTKNIMPSLGSSRWSTSASSVAKNLKAPMSWHGGKGTLSPSRFSANFPAVNPLTPPLSKRKSGNGGSPKLPKKSPSPKSGGGGGDDNKSVKSVGSFIRGSKIYKIQAPFNSIKSFVPMASSDSSSVKSSTSKSSRWSSNSQATAGISVEPLPDRWAAKKRSEKEPALAVPVEEDEEEDEEYEDGEYEDDYEDEVIDLNDQNGDREPSEEFDKEFDMPVNFDKGPVREFVVDRVPRKRWTSQNVENFPIWPPIIKVRGYEANRGGNVSAISVGSGFTDDDYLTDDFSSDEEGSFVEKALPPAQRTSYRIRYDGRTNLNLDVYEADHRFASTVEQVQPDGAPNLPARNMDSTPGMPPRRHSEHSHGSLNSGSEYSEELGESNEFAEDSRHSRRSRPDVWITALSGEQEEDVIWNVRRVWDIEQEDEGEKEVSVHSQQLFSKIKTLVGATDDDSLGADQSQAGTVTTQKSDVKPKMPTRSWQIQKVVETKGKLADLEPPKKLDDKDMVNDIQTMNSEAVVELKENIKAQEELVRRITERRVEKKEKVAKGIVEPQVEDTEEAAPPLTKEEQEKWFGDEDADTLDDSEILGEQDAEGIPPPSGNPQRFVSDSTATMISIQESIISTKPEEKSKEVAIVEEEKVDTSLQESMHSKEDETQTPTSSTAKVEKASETASVNSLDSLQSSMQSTGESKASAPAEDKVEQDKVEQDKEDDKVEEKAPPSPPEPATTPPPPAPADITPPQKRRSLSPKSPKTPKTPKTPRTTKSPGRKGSKKKKESKSSSKSPRIPPRSTVDEAPKTPRRNHSNENLVLPAPKSAKREKRKGKKKKTSKKKKEKKSTAADFLQTSSSESEVDERPSSEKILRKDRKPVSPKRRVTAIDSRKLSMSAMVVGSDSDSDDSSDSNTDAATKNLMKKHQTSSGAATPWWKKQQQQAASKKGGRPTITRRAQSDRYLGKK